MYPIQPVERLLAGIIRARPRLGFRLADAYGPVNYALFLREPTLPRRAQVLLQELTGCRHPRAFRRLMRFRMRRFERRRILESLLAEGGYSNLYPISRWKHEEHLTPTDRPIIAVTWHAGPFSALPIGVTALGRAATLLISSDFRIRPQPDLEVCSVSDSAGGVEAFRKCSAALRQGRIVVTAADQIAQARGGYFTQLLDLNVYVKRGFASLARRCNASVVPVSVEWSENDELVFTASPPLSVSLSDRTDARDFERRMVQEFASVAHQGLLKQAAEIDTHLLRVFSDLAREQGKHRRKREARPGGPVDPGSDP